MDGIVIPLIFMYSRWTGDVVADPNTVLRIRVRARQARPRQGRDGAVDSAMVVRSRSRPRANIQYNTARAV